MTLRLCLIGCGGIANGYHGPSYVRYAAVHPELVLAACCDAEASRAEAFRARFGFARAYTDFHEMLRIEAPDAVCMAVPPPMTCELGCIVMSQGFPLFLEKPPGLTVTEIDRLIATAAAYAVPNQVAFNRRHTPLVRRLKELLSKDAADGPVQHLRYDFTRIGRVDLDFSTTAIHGIDTVRCIAGCDFTQVAFRYQHLPEYGPTVANVFLDGEMTSGVTIHLAFCPVAGAVTERATVYAHDRTYYLNLPIWNGFDAPGRLQCLHKGMSVIDETGPQLSDGLTDDFVLNGFYAENASFFDDIRAGNLPVDDLTSARQSVEIMQCIRERQHDYRATRMGS